MQTRTRTELRFEPDHDLEEERAIRRFRMEKRTFQETRRSDREIWRFDGNLTREDVATGLTRDDLVKLISEAADWLSYMEAEQP